MNITRGLRRALQINPKGLGVQDMIISGSSPAPRVPKWAMALRGIIKPS